MSVITGSRPIDVMRMVVLLGALRLELLGMKRSGPSAFSIVKAEYNLKGSKQSVFTQFSRIVELAKQGREQ